jgi:hypothetical protein
VLKKRACVIAVLSLASLLASAGACGTQGDNKYAGDNSSPSPSPPPSPDLQEQLLRAQIDNQQAQTRYYERQFSQSLVAGVQSLLGALLGASIAFLGLWLQGRRQERLERDRWSESRKDDLGRWNRDREVEREKWNRDRDADREKWSRERDAELLRWGHAREEERLRWERAKIEERLKETRLSVAELVKKITAAAHSMTWILWIARFDPNNFNIGHARDHDKNMNKLYTELVGAQAVVAALDETLYRGTVPIVERVYFYDALIGRIVARSGLSDRKDVQDLGDLWEQVYKFSNGIPDEIATVMKLRDAPPPAEGE